MGDYDRDFDASIEGGVGEATVLLPSEVGARVRAEGGLGKINAMGFPREGDSYVNDAYGDADVTLLEYHKLCGCSRVKCGS
jgi:hypothetical protein